ncbi:uncharacterized protein RHO25_001984 [Cercospora beticola]|uniref:Uncharacterized protein n=1 Tax=Cercospora beticola TaxID=122368 RepID=A0ABZ0NCW8_CERBT|nr:hypothetical protein RHO25_001984 [Cercospora beticola]
MVRTRDPLDPPELPNQFVQPVHSYYELLAEIQDFHRMWSEKSRSWNSQGVTAETRLAVLAVPNARNKKELRNHIHPIDPTFPARFVVGGSHKPTSDIE